ncbi:HAD family hydrolase [Halobacteriales archaeon QS_5_70_17]|nr:MAG: HAD family hydrolase [Halobacteriales archaeon QS_5_70_17]
MQSPSPITTVLFDLDDTLLEYNRSRAAALRAAFDDAGTEPFCGPEDLRRAARAVEGADSDREFLRHLFAVAADRAGASDRCDPAALARAYDGARDHADVAFRPGAEAALALREEYAVGLITNGSRATQRTKLEALGIDDAFETAVYAGDGVASKPDPEPFERALAALDATPAECLYVGNSLYADVRGAGDAGLRTAWFPTSDAADANPDPDPVPDYVLDSLSDLPALLRAA